MPADDDGQRVNIAVSQWRRAIMYEPVLCLTPLVHAVLVVACSARAPPTSDHRTTIIARVVSDPLAAGITVIPTGNTTSFATNATAEVGFNNSSPTSVVRGIYTRSEIDNSSAITICQNVSRSVDEFPRDFFTEDQRRHGAIVFHVLVAFYGFVFIAFVCNDYFLPSVFCICLDLGVSPDVAGATFMATATCAPELCVSLVGTFLTESDLGVGTVVGSAVYNALGVTACAGLAAGKAIALDEWPLLRDSALYAVAIVALAVVVADGAVTWYEALSLLALYVGYFVLMFTQGELWTAAKKLKNKNSFRSWTRSIECARRLLVKTPFCGKITTDETRSISASSGSDARRYGTTPTNSTNPSKSDIAGYGVYGSFYFTEYVPPEPPVETSQTTKDHARMQNGEEQEHRVPRSVTPVWKVPEGVLPTMWWAFSLPVAFTLSMTVPDCRTRRNVYPFTFVMCIVWIAVSTYVVSWMLAVCGDTFHISDIVMGIAVLAAGSSIPEATSGIINARNGEGSMSISNSLGANTLDILLCLGLPWFVKSLMNGGPVAMQNNNLFFNCVCMIVSVIVLNVAAAVNGFKMCKMFGVICLVGHLVIMTILIIHGLNVRVEQC